MAADTGGRIRSIVSREHGDNPAAGVTCVRTCRLLSRRKTILEAVRSEGDLPARRQRADTNIGPKHREAKEHERTSADMREKRTDVVHEQLRLFEGGEVPRAPSWYSDRLKPARGHCAAG